MKEILNSHLANKIKSLLYGAGLSERYISFDYTTYILQFFIVVQDDSFKTYQQALKNIENEYKICHRTICHSVNTFLKKCKTQYCLYKDSNRTLSKLKSLRTYIEKNLDSAQ